MSSFLSEDFLALGTVFDYRLTWYSCETWPDKNYLLRVRELTRSKFFAGTAKVTFDFGSGKYVSRNGFILNSSYKKIKT